MRHKEKFFVDDAYLNGYAKYLGTTNSMIYFILCRHADKNQECFPSYEFIAERLGVSEATIKRGVKILKDWNIISIGKRKRKNGQFLHNSYVLLDKSVWQSKPWVISDLRQPEVMDDTNQGSPMHQTTGHPRPDKDTHSKDTHSKDTHTEGAETSSAEVVVVIDEFKKWNPSAKNWYRNTTQRKACEDLIESYGLEQILKVIPLLPKTNARPYLPTITTALQLFEKYTVLQSGLERMKTEKTLSKSKVAF